MKSLIGGAVLSLPMFVQGIASPPLPPSPLLPLHQILKSPPCSKHLWKTQLLKDLVIKTNNKKVYLIYKLLKYLSDIVLSDF